MITDEKCNAIKKALVEYKRGDRSYEELLCANLDVDHFELEDPHCNELISMRSEFREMRETYQSIKQIVVDWGNAIGLPKLIEQRGRLQKAIEEQNNSKENVREKYAPQHTSAVAADLNGSAQQCASNVAKGAEKQDAAHETLKDIKKKGGNRNKTFASFVNNAKDESINEILNGAKPLSNEEPKLADYFDTLVRTGELQDIPTKGALHEKGFSVSDNWKSLCCDRRKKRD